MNRYPFWKYLLIIAIIAVGCLYALPNLYGKDPALQVSASRGGEISELTRFSVEDALDTAGIKYGDISVAAGNLVVRFADEETQLKAQDVVKEGLGRSYTVALNLAPATPGWLRALGAEPMFLGLDLRGGVHFLMQVDMEAAVAKAEERYVSDIRTQLRDERIRYRTITRRRDGGLLIRFRDAEQRPGLCFLGSDERRQSAAESFVARRQQEVPDEGIDGGPGDDADPGQVLVHGSDDGEIDGHQ